jgi:hypothetical protein
MPLSREERKLLHQKSKQPTLGVGRPDNQDGYEGDISFRQIDGSGTVEYVKKSHEWVAVASSGEMPPVRIIGGTRGAVGSGVGITSHGDLAGLGDDNHVQYLLVDGTRAMTSTMTIGADADGTDRSVVWGHSTLKTIMGIDDSSDAFVINTDAAFDATLANNSFSIDASHNVIIAGGLTVGSTITAASIGAGTDNSVVVLNSSGLLKTDEIDSRVWGSTLVDTDASGANNELATWSDANTIIGEGNLTFTGSALTCIGTLTVGVDDTGHDVKFFGASAGSFMLWDEANDTLDIRGATAAGPGKLKLSTGELTVVDGDILGRIDFQAPLEGSGSDAILVGASIWAEAEDTFGTGQNETDIVFATAVTETATEKARLTTVGRFGVGTSANTSGAVDAKLHVCGAGVDYGGENLTAVFQDTSSFGINQGGAIGFSAWRDNDDTDSYAFGAIAGRKEDATTGNEQGYLTLYSRPISTFKDTDLTGGSLGKLQEVVRITSARNVGIGLQSPTCNFEIKGTLSFPLSDTTSTSSGTGNRTIASTNHGLEVGDSVGLPSGSSDLIERFTVASVTDANVFVVDSDLTGSITNKLGYKDSNLFGIRNADNVKLITVDSSGRLGLGTTSPGSYANPASLISYSDTNNYKAVFDTDGDIHTIIILDAGNGGTNRNATVTFKQDGANAWSEGMYALDYKIQNDAQGSVFPFVILNGADDGAFKIDADGNTLIKGYALSNSESYAVSIKPVNATNHLTMGHADKQNNYSMIGIYSAAAAGISGVTADGSFDAW